MSSNIVSRHGTDLRGDEIVRYTLKERMSHWIAGVSYLYLLASGLALFTPYFYWIAYVLGGGPTIRFWHPWVGLIFMVGVFWMHSMWRADMKTTKEDLEWRKTIKAYVTNHDEAVAPAGHFNSGQKQFYWIMFYGGLTLLVTGVLMWFPELVAGHNGSTVGHMLLPLIVFLHCVAALFTIGAFIIHVYMGIFFVSGGLHGILWGRVPSAWVKAHHPLWYEKVIRDDRSRVSPTAFKHGAGD
jgi:formate dehydrogenase subunit gamma